MDLPDRGLRVAAEHAVARSPEWPAARRAFLHTHGQCAVCGVTTGLQAHHVRPFHVCVVLGRADLELDPRNLLALCETEVGCPGQDHHLIVGHLGDFKAINPEVIRDAAQTWHGMLGAQIRADPRWVAACQCRTKPLREWTAAERIAFLAEANANCPKDNHGG